MLKSVGADIDIYDNKTSIRGMSQPLSPLNMRVPADPSTAAFFAGAVSLLPQSELIIKIYLLIPQGSNFLIQLNRWVLSWTYFLRILRAENVSADIFIKNKRLRSISIEKSKVPSLIDEIPILAVIATQAEGKTIIRGAEELRVKESDRIESILFNLRNMGAIVEEFNDGFSIEGLRNLTALPSELLEIIE